MERGATRDEAINDLKKAIQLYVEEFGVEDATERLVSQIEVHQLGINLKDFSFV
jgi:predicted RNase H-like HicB family nuclease